MKTCLLTASEWLFIPPGLSLRDTGREDEGSREKETQAESAHAATSET